MKSKWLRRGFYGLLLLMLLLPLNTTFQYLSGTARLKYVGLPDPEFYNIDRKYRCHNSTSGCLVLGYEWFTQGLSNATLRLLIGLFGFQKGAYTGDYPTVEEVVKIVKTEEKPIELADKSVAIHLEGLGDIIEINPFETTNWVLKSEFYNNVEPNGKLKGRCVLKNDFLVLTIDEHPSDTTNSYYYLIDARKGETFALYDRNRNN